ncbi:MAG: patatin-like phospholipase family protein [Desulfobacteraceae bacterium]|nr:MAG: patatin-like phospholipase family protein [Desulfobacteraceae bacterium]
MTSGMQAKRAAPALCIYAGEKARGIIRDEGLRPDRVRIVAGAAGGPKWLVLHGLDRRWPLFFAHRTKPLFLIGASIGAWRFLCAVLGDGALDRFREGYIEQRYEHKPSTAEVTGQTWCILRHLLADHSPGEALSHAFYRMSVLTVRSRHLIQSGRKVVQGLGLTGAALANLARRKWLKYFFERSLFYDGRDIPPFLGMNDFPTQKTLLTPANLLQATIASGSIPLVMQGIPDIPGAKAGIYLDGGIVDYHIDIDYLGADDHHLVLYPHYTDRIVPGWLDKHLTWRTPRSERTQNLVLVSPSREFVQALPYAKIPDRNDFALFFKRDGERIAYWRTAVEASERLGEEFFEAVQSGRIRELVRPLPWQK